MSIKTILLRIFTWWNGVTWGTALYTRFRGVRVGEDEQGNVYYRTRDDSRRWVVYNGYAEGSRVPPGWHGWLHRRTDIPPGKEGYVPHPWEKPHLPNPTGSAQAIYPPGSLYRRKPVALAAAPHESWRPADAEGEAG